MGEREDEQAVHPRTPALPAAEAGEVLLLRARELELKYIVGIGKESPGDLAKLVKEWLEEEGQ